MDRILKSKYRIQEQLAESPLQITYKGEFVDTKKPVVIKIFKREFLNSIIIKKLKSDVSNLVKLNIENVPRFYDGDYGWQGFYFVRDYVEATPLSQISIPLDSEEASGVVVLLCKAIENAHSCGLIHGALTPNNIFIKDNTDVIIADFGVNDTVFSSTEQKINMFFDERAAFLAPENIAGDPSSEKTDIYQIGILLYLLLTGKVPAKGINGIDITLNTIMGNTAAPSSINPKVPKHMDDIVMKCLNKEQRLRFESVAEIEESLNNKGIVTKTKETFDIPDLLPQSSNNYDERKKEDKRITKENEWEKAQSNIMIRLIMIAVAGAILAGVIYSLFSIFVIGK